jgi:hypothetical protein
MKPLNILLAVLVMTFAGCATQSSPKTKAEPQAASLIFDRFIESHGSREAEFFFTNASPRSLWFGGYGPQSPLYKIQYLKGDRWQESPLGWCGNGIGWQELPSGSGVIFQVLIVPEDLKPLTIRVGVSCWPEKDHKKTAVHTYWSDAVRVRR